MAVIALEDVHFYAYHGFYEEEQIIGNEFVLDIYVETRIGAAAEEDDLYQTVNYETIYLLCLAEMRKPAMLIETVAQHIVDRIENHFDELVKGIKLKLRKLNPPLGGRVGCASIEITTGIFDLPSLRTMKSLRKLSGDLKELKED